MRILFAITKGEVGGAQEYVKILARGLMEEGHQLAVAVSQPSSLAESMAELGATVLAWSSITGSPSPLRDLAARRELRQLVRSWGPDVMHLNSSKAGVIGTGLLSAPDGVTVFTCHHAPFGPGRLWRNRIVSRPVEQVALPRLDGIISVGLRDVPALQRLAPNVPVRVIANAVATNGPPVSVGPLSPVALWVARMAHPKDPVLAVEAWERVVAEMPGARLIMCGTGPLEQVVRERIGRSTAQSTIEYPGYVDDLRPLRARASLFLLTTHVEGGLTMATLEAMTEGLVPVVSDAGDARVLEERQLGICVDRRTPEAVAHEVVRLLGDPEHFAELRRNALAYSRVERTPPDVIRETTDFYSQVLTAKGVKHR